MKESPRDTPWITFMATVMTVCVWLAPVRAIGAEPVKAYARDGRILSGEVDVRTDEHHLWIRSTAPSIVLLSSLAWDQLERARYGDEELSAEEFRRISKTKRSALPRDFFATPSPPLVEAPQADPGKESSGSKAPMRSQHVDARAQLAVQRRVQTLHVEAFVARWGRNVTDDGLELHVYPLDEYRQFVPVDGTLSVRLHGQFIRWTGRQRHRRVTGTNQVFVEN